MQVIKYSVDEYMCSAVLGSSAVFENIIQVALYKT